ncbi:hypothetical protein B0J11DRAFT_521071 [Dendryphion nanum]|uniref:C2H2-type domain-containing protein n=1 Tax=Dendryphion nanum TaxID=256645 RepID=A0A9P9E7R0_9PLEO|nr:hypothetical protein B0J11DRAFT_521071 [Dendryphion nanum]
MVASTLVHDYSASELKKCPLQPCDFTFIYRNTEYFLHLRKAHANVYTCNFCQKHFSSQYRLSYHVERSGHAAIHCHHDGCGRVFSRADTYQRHLRTHQKDAQRFPCTYCKKYRGENGFKRKDHLRQHVRNYHHIEDVESGTQLLLNSSRKYACPCMACPQYRQNPFRGPFKKFSEYMAHMKSVHNESDYPCPEPNCERVDGKGYFRKADLRTHLRKIHGTDGALAGDQV